jgi:hypothetical protein
LCLFGTFGTNLVSYSKKNLATLVVRKSMRRRGCAVLQQDDNLPLKKANRPGLPDGIHSFIPKSKSVHVLEGLGMDNAGMIYGHLE